MSDPFIASIETSAGTFQYGFHLGTDPRVARQEAERLFKNPPSHRMQTGSYVISVALMMNRKMYDCFDGHEWESQRDYLQGGQDDC